MSKSRKAEVANSVHEYEIYEGGSVLELGYVQQFPNFGEHFPKTFSMRQSCTTNNKSNARVLTSATRFTQQLMTRNSNLNIGIHNQHFIIEPQ